MLPAAWGGRDEAAGAAREDGRQDGDRVSSAQPSSPRSASRDGEAEQIAAAIRLSSQKARRLKERENLQEGAAQPLPRPPWCHPRGRGSKRGGGGSVPGWSGLSTELLSRPPPSRPLVREGWAGSCTPHTSKAARAS